MHGRLTLLLGGLIVAAPGKAYAQARTLDSAAIQVAAPSARSVVLVDAANVSFVITGHPGADVTAALVDTAGRRSNLSYAGVIRIAAAHDTVRISLASAVRAPYQLRVTVPVAVALGVHGDNGGPVLVSGIGGAVEISHSNGSVSVLDAAGYALIATSNGNLTAGLASVTPGQPMSFITDNGFVDLTFPASIKATLVIDEGIAVESEYPLTPDGGRTPGPRRLLINGGGPTIRVFTNNGNLRLHRAAPSN